MYSYGRFNCVYVYTQELIDKFFAYFHILMQAYINLIMPRYGLHSYLMVLIKYLSPDMRTGNSIVSLTKHDQHMLRSCQYSAVRSYKARK